MSGWRSFGGLLGALSARLQGRTREEAANGLDEPRGAGPEPSTERRLDDALAGLRRRIPAPDQKGSDPDQKGSEPAGSDD